MSTPSTDIAANTAIVELKAVFERFAKAAAPFKAKLLAAVEKLLAEGYEPKAIKTAIRAISDETGVSPQYVNRILATPVKDGGAGLGNDRVKEKKASSAADKPTADFNIMNPELLFEAMRLATSGDLTQIECCLEAVFMKVAAAKVASRK